MWHAVYLYLDCKNVLSVKGITHPNFSSYTVDDVGQNVLDSLYSIMKVNGDAHCQAPKMSKRHHKSCAYSLCTIFQVFWSLMKALCGKQMQTDSSSQLWCFRYNNFIFCFKLTKLNNKSELNCLHLVSPASVILRVGSRRNITIKWSLNLFTSIFSPISYA